MPYARALLVLSVVVGVAPLLPACGGSDSNPTSPSASGPKLSEVPAELATTLCDVTAKCLGPIADVYLAGQSCMDKQLTELQEGGFSLLQGAVDDHRVTYDGSKVAGCLDAVEKAGCGVFSNRIGTLCDGVFTGTVASGGDCTLDEECKKDLFCQVGSTCPGKCTPLLAAGGDCKKSDSCKDGLICSDTSKTCIAPGAEGDTCGGTSGKECPANLVCVGATATQTGTCKTIDSVFAASDGASCDPTNAVFCKADLRCSLASVDQAGKAAWKCEKPATSQTCHLGYPETCPFGQFCRLETTGSVDGTCKPLPGDGEACGGTSAADTNKDKCAATALCVSGTCKAIQHLGGSCASDDECIGKLCKGGKCVPSECGG
jgi:hypothetical protein